MYFVSANFLDRNAAQPWYARLASADIRGGVAVAAIMAQDATFQPADQEQAHGCIIVGAAQQVEVYGIAGLVEFDAERWNLKNLACTKDQVRELSFNNWREKFYDVATKQHVVGAKVLIMTSDRKVYGRGLVYGKEEG